MRCNAETCYALRKVCGKSSDNLAVLSHYDMRRRLDYQIDDRVFMTIEAELKWDEIPEFAWKTNQRGESSVIRAIIKLDNENTRKVIKCSPHSHSQFDAIMSQIYLFIWLNSKFVSRCDNEVVFHFQLTLHRLTFGVLKTRQICVRQSSLKQN